MNISEFSNKHSINPKLVQALINIESAGSGRNTDNSVKIRLEAHLVVQRFPQCSPWFKYSSARPWENQFFKFPSHSTLWRNLHDGYQWTEYQGLLVASLQIQFLAWDCISMGRMQILGSHYKRLGFDSSIAMYTFCAADINNDLVLGLKFLETDSNLMNAMRNNNIEKITEIYNGAANVPVYSRLLRNELARL